MVLRGFQLVGFGYLSSCDLPVRAQVAAPAKYKNSREIIFPLSFLLFKILGIQALLIQKVSWALGEPQEPTRHISKQENPIH